MIALETLQLDQGWRNFFTQPHQQQCLQSVLTRVQQARDNGVTIYPPAAEVFRAFELTPLAKVRVVILGQDPYHGPGQAHGLSFSVPAGVKFPPSLRNIFKAISHDEPDYHIPLHGDLSHWARQGVLLLNTVLTVEQGKAHAHAGWGWETFTDAVIEHINAAREGVVFLLWGAHAQKKQELIDPTRHHVLTSVHPSPLSAHRGFFECGHFRRVNALLTPPIEW